MKRQTAAAIPVQLELKPMAHLESTEIAILLLLKSADLSLGRQQKHVLAHNLTAQQLTHLFLEMNKIVKSVARHQLLTVPRLTLRTLHTDHAMA